ncbi:hypothetical protein XspCFBP7912_02615 [Xanthomonas sp. CFBP 7912]|nr:hypothetical protein XspCFBP7912_02615 [Xanthomonas sp. CFBP 7912]RJS02876.1 hypothetical protein XnspCFBP7698_14965 [Xanthomonas sp. CFBP 7698]
MRTFVIFLTIAVCAFVIPLGFRFSPNKLYLLLSLCASLAVWLPFHRYLVGHWSVRPRVTRAAKINASNVVVQATIMSAAVFFLSCFVFGIFFTMAVGNTTLQVGRVISSWPSRRCTNLKVKTETAGFVSLCTRYPLGVGSAIAVRVRTSALGHYVE